MAGRGLYRFIYHIVRLVYPKMTVEGTENLPAQACVIVGNHAQMDGPITGILYYPRAKRVWCTGEMMNRKEVPAYAYQDFWSKKPKWIRWYYKLSSYAIAPLAECIFTNTEAIPVYKDRRLADTFRLSVDALREGKDLIIFPEGHAPHNGIVYDFQKGFVDVARLFEKETEKPLAFVPAYLAPSLKKMVLGNPVVYDSSRSSREERERICTYLMDAITDLARELPRHRVTPYENMAKSDYPYNKEES